MKTKTVKKTPKILLSRSSLLCSAATLGIALFMPGHAHAAAVSYTWNNGNTGGNWSTIANWSPATSLIGPTTSDTVTLSDVTAGTRTITYDAAASGAVGTLVFSQTDAATNSLVVSSSMAITNAVTLGASGGGTANITLATTGASQSLTLNVPTLTVNSGGSLILGFGASTGSGNMKVYAHGSGLVISGGLVTIAAPTAYSGTPVIALDGAFTMTSGTLNFGQTSSTNAGRLNVYGNFTATGGVISSVGTPSMLGSQLQMGGATNTIVGATLDANTTLYLIGGDQTLTTDQALNALGIRYNGTKTLTSSNANHTVASLQWANGVNAGTTTLKMGSDLQVGNAFQSVGPGGSGTTVNFVIDTAGHTLTSGTAFTAINRTNGNTGVVNWTFTTSTGTGTIAAPSFDLSRIEYGMTSSVGANTIIQATASGTSNLGLTGYGTIDPTSTFLSTGGSASLLTNRAIGNLTVGNGTASYLKLISGTSTSITAAGTVSVATSGTLDINAQNLSGAGLSGVSGATVTNLNATASALTLNGTSGSYTYAGAIAGKLSLAKTGNSTQILSGANTYTGTTTVSAGELDINGTSTGSAVSVTSGAILGGSGTVNGTVSISNATLNGSGLTTSSATFSGNSTLAGTSTATSGYTVTGGNLNVIGTTSSSVNVTSGLLQGTGSVGSVALSGTLAGTLSTGALSGSGLVSPGNSPGILTTTSLASGNSLSFAFELSSTKPDYTSATGSLNDILHVTNSSAGLNLSSNNSISIYFSSLSASAVTPGTYEGSFYVDGLDASSLLSAFNSANVTYYLLDNQGSTTFNGETYSAFSNGNNTISVSALSETTTLGTGSTLEFIVVPEPSVYAMLAGGLGLLAFGQKLRRRSSNA